MSAARGHVEHDVRFLVVGAVEEEAATSKGARFIRDQLNGTTQPLPDACIIGEPSSWRRVTLGYKGRLLVSLNASQPMAHTAGPDAGVSTVAVDFWNWIADYCDEFNADREKIFDRLLPSLRGLHSDTDEQLHDTVVAQSGIRLPLDFDVMDLVEGLATWAVDRSGSQQGADVTSLLPEFDGTLRFDGSTCTIELAFRGYERAWRSDSRNDLVRCFLGAIREADPDTRPGFVVKTGTSDMNVVGPAWQCPILAYGPGDSNLDHTPNEHIHLDEYWQAVQVLEQALRSWSYGEPLRSLQNNSRRHDVILSTTRSWWVTVKLTGVDNYRSDRQYFRAGRAECRLRISFLFLAHARLPFPLISPFVLIVAQTSSKYVLLVSQKSPKLSISDSNRPVCP